MNTLINYIQIVITNMKEKAMQKSLSDVYMFINLLTVLHTVIIFGVVVELS